jgi:hypothetical protein
MKGARMLDLYMDWNSFLIGMAVGMACAWFVCDLVFPVKNNKEDEKNGHN